MLTWGARGRPGQQQQPEAGKQQSRAAAAGAASGRPAAARPRDQRDPGAGLPVHGRASASAPRPQHSRPAPGRASPLGAFGLGRGGRCGCCWDPAPLTGAEGGRRGGGGPGAGTADRGRQPHAGLAAPPPSEPPSRCPATRGPRRGAASTTSRPAARLPAGRRERRAGRRGGSDAPGLCDAGPGPPPGPASREGARGDAGGLGQAGGRRRPDPHPTTGPAAWWPRAFCPRGRRDPVMEARQEGSERETWPARRAAGLSLLPSRLPERCSIVCGAAGVSGAPAFVGTGFGAAEGTKQRKGRRFLRARHAVTGVRKARTQRDPSFLLSRGSASCPGHWTGRSGVGRPTHPARSRPSEGAY